MADICNFSDAKARRDHHDIVDEYSLTIRRHGDDTISVDADGQASDSFAEIAFCRKVMNDLRRLHSMVADRAFELSGSLDDKFVCSVAMFASSWIRMNWSEANLASATAAELALWFARATTDMLHMAGSGELG